MKLTQKEIQENLKTLIDDVGGALAELDGEDLCQRITEIRGDMVKLWLKTNAS